MKNAQRNLADQFSALIELIRLMVVIAVATAASGPARAQCTGHWMVDSTVNGIDTIVSAQTVWDPDGPGPLPEMLVVFAGNGTAGHTKFERLVMWDVHGYS